MLKNTGPFLHWAVEKFCPSDADLTARPQAPSAPGSGPGPLGQERTGLLNQEQSWGLGQTAGPQLQPHPHCSTDKWPMRERGRMDCRGDGGY